MCEFFPRSALCGASAHAELDRVSRLSREHFTIKVTLSPPRTEILDRDALGVVRVGRKSERSRARSWRESEL